MGVEEPGRVIGGFTLLEELGRGAAAQVFRVRRPDDPEHYALKLLDAGGVEPERAAAALRREAALLATVDHPGLVVIHEIGEHAGRLFLVMDLVDGRTLAEVLAQGPMPPDRVIALAQGLAAPLAAVHRRGLLHRDLKPDNIMILSDGQVRLIDFGLVDRQAETVTATVAGTLSYAAPEQTGMLRRPPDHRSDLYSLGVVLFECLAGHLPFAADDVADLLRLHATLPAPDLRDLVPGVPPGLAALIAVLLAKDPDDRYDDAWQLAAELERIERSPADPFVPLRVAPRWAAAARRSPELCGRDAEVDRLRQRWDAARGGAGGVWRVGGAAGVGKSALATDLAALAEGQGALVLHGRSSPDDPMPLAPLRAALVARLAEIERLPAAARGRAEERIVAAAGDEGALLVGLAPALSRLLGSEPASPTDLRDHFDLAVASLLTRLAQAHRGLLLIMDDVQWLDPATARTLGRLATELDGVPLLVLLLGRTDSGESAQVPGVADELDLELGPLSASAVADLVRDALPGADPGPRLADLIAARSAGNPFVAHEYVGAIADAGLLSPRWGTWSLDEAGMQALELPQDALGLLLTRVQALPPRTRELLVTAAAVGSRFRPALVAAVHGLDDAELVRVVADAVGHGLLEPGADGCHVFVHDGVRRVLVDGLDPDEAARLHRRIAAALEAEAEPAGGPSDEHVYAVAHHYLAGGAAHAPREAFDACRRAGRLALDSAAPAEALEFLGAAARILAAAAGTLPDPGPRFSLDHALALSLNSELEQARGVLEASLATAEDPMTRAEVLAALAEVHRAGWAPERAVETVREGLAELGAPLPRSAPRMLASALRLYLGSLVLRRTGWRFGTARGAELERCRLIIRLHGIAGFAALLNGSMGLMVILSLRSAYWANRIGSGREYVATHSQLAFLNVQLGRMAAADRIQARLRNDEGWSDPVMRAVVADMRGGAHYFAGRDDGELFTEALLEQGRWLDTAAYRDGCDALRLHEANAGRTRQAVLWGERAARRLAPADEAASTPVYRFTQAVVEAVRGRPAQAAAIHREASAALPAEPPSGVAVVQRLAELALLREQDETGEPFDRAVEAFEALRLAPRSLLRMHRMAYFHIATGRLAQARRAPEAERAELLAQARAALRTMRSFRRDTDLRALERVARADLLQQQGDPRAALGALAELTGTDRHDVPLAAYEGARVRARALAALGLPEESDRQVRFAIAVAQDEGWPHRAGWLITEFGAAAARRGQTAASGSMSGSGSGSGSVLGSLSGSASGSVSGSRSTSSWASASASRSASERTAGPSATTGGTHRADVVVVVERQRQRLQALQQVSLAASRVVDPSALARISLEQTIRILSAERAFLFLTDEQERLVPFLGRDAAGNDLAELTGYSASLVERVHETGQPLVVTGTEEGAALGAQSVVLHGLRSIVIAPLLLEQRRLGVVYLDSQVAKGIFTADDVDILTALTTHIATSLETARAAQLAISVQTARRERDLAEHLREASQALADAATPVDVLSRLLELACTLARGDDGWIAASGPDGLRLHRRQGPVGGEPIAGDPALDALLLADRPVSGTPDAVPVALQPELAGASWLALPLRSRELGVAALILRTGDAAEDPVRDGAIEGSDVPANQADIANALVTQAATAYDRAALFARVQALAVADELTGIANRRHFFDVARRDVEAAARAGRPLAALMVDIDHFKVVNDTHGHPTGDDVIRTVAQRMAAELRTTDLLGRYGGEEFAVVLLDLPDPFHLAERLRARIADSPVVTRSGPLPVTVSVGLARLAPGDDLESLLARADQALYRAKQDGRDRVCVDGAGPSAPTTSAWAPSR